MKTKYFFSQFFLLFSFIVTIGYAQTTMQSYYEFSTTLGTYTELSSPTVLTNYGGDDFYLANNGSSVTGPGYQIPFSFYFNGEYFTRVGISSNGWIGLGTEADGVNLSGLYYAPISSTTTISPSRLRNRIVAFGQDIMHLGASYTPAISYATLGTSPNRIFVVQFKGWRRYGSDFGNDVINFQIKLYETSYKVEIIYGSMGASTTTNGIQVGLGGNNTSEYFNLTTTNNWNSPTSGSSVEANMTFGNGVFPSNGRTYTWTLRKQE